MAYEKFKVQINARLLALTLVKPSAREVERVLDHNNTIKDSPEKPWRLPTDNWVADFLFSQGGVNELIHLPFKTQPKMEVGKTYNLGLELQAPKIYINIDTFTLVP